MHRVHHSDAALDVTTAFRHHPLERSVALAWHGGVAVALGLVLAGLLLYGVAALLLSVPQHADLRLPAPLDRLLAVLVATPAAHRVHHSARPAETDSNYGEVLTLWDRLFGTWRSGGGAAPVGLDDPDHARLSAQLMSPFRR